MEKSHGKWHEPVLKFLKFSYKWLKCKICCQSTLKLTCQHVEIRTPQKGCDWGVGTERPFYYISNVIIVTRCITVHSQSHNHRKIVMEKSWKRHWKVMEFDRTNCVGTLSYLGNGIFFFDIPMQYCPAWVSHKKNGKEQWIASRIPFGTTVC